MSVPARKLRSRRRVAAFNFLSNISLDGTHRDTKYSIFLKRGLDTQIKRPAGSKLGETGVAERKEASASDDCEADNVGDGEVFLPNPKENIQGILTARDENVSKRNRASSYSGDRPKPRRMRLLTSVSISEDDPTEIVKPLGGKTAICSQNNISSFSGSRVRHKSTSGSTSSVSSGPKPPGPVKEVRFINPDKQKFNTRDSRMVLVSGRKGPVVIYSALPYSKKDTSIKTEVVSVQRVRHSSGGSKEALLNLGLLAVEKVEDGQDVSYSQFLVPSKPRHCYTGRAATAAVNPSDGTPHVPPESAQSSPGTMMDARELPFFRSFSHDPSLLQRYHSMAPVLRTVHEREGDPGGGDLSYDPNLLDDPELMSGKHRTLMKFPSYMTSVIDYAKPSELKKELNQKFRDKFPHIQLTLSKLRSLKRVLRKIGHVKCGLDLWVVAQSYVFFEKIILKGMVTKGNRRLCVAACLILSSKLNDVKGQALTRLIEESEETFKLHRRDMVAFEFGVLVALEFALHISDMEVYPHYQRLLYTS